MAELRLQLSQGADWRDWNEQEASLTAVGAAPIPEDPAELVAEKGDFALVLDRGGMRWAWPRGRENLQKRSLVHVAGYVWA